MTARLSSYVRSQLQEVKENKVCYLSFKLCTHTPSQSYPYVVRAYASVEFSCQTAESPIFHLKREGRKKGGGERGGEGEKVGKKMEGGRKREREERGGDISHATSSNGLRVYQLPWDLRSAVSSYWRC